MYLISLIFLGISLVFALAVVLLRWLARLLSPRLSTLGIDENGRLRKCPPTPNCVCSKCAPDSSNYIPPIKFEGTAGQAMDQILDILSLLPRNLIIEQTHDYLCIGFRSYLWRFLDDVEFFIEEKAKLIHVRSAARLGY